MVAVIEGQGNGRSIGADSSQVITLAGCIPQSRNFRPARPRCVTASAARYPLRTAPSMVAGQPDRVQSPARNRFGILVALHGRAAPAPARPKTSRALLSPRALSRSSLLSRAGKTRPVLSPPARSLRPRHVHQTPRRAHHQLQISPAGFVEHPLDRPVQQRRVRQFGNAAIEPQVNPGDRRMLEGLMSNPRSGNQCRQAFEGHAKCNSRPIAACLPRSRLALRLLLRSPAPPVRGWKRTFPIRFHASGAKVLPAAPPGFPSDTNSRRRENPARKPENLTGGHTIQLFIYRAHQNLIPETPDRPFGLAAFRAAIRAS